MLPWRTASAEGDAKKMILFWRPEPSSTFIREAENHLNRTGQTAEDRERPWRAPAGPQRTAAPQRPSKQHFLCRGKPSLSNTATTRTASLSQVLSTHPNTSYM
ncbi:hypothetical protein GN956_G17331 [Arapaima gigas]